MLTRCIFMKKSERFVSSKVTSLRRKRFCGVWEQRKTEDRDFRCFARAKNGTRDKKTREGGGGGEGKNNQLCFLAPFFAQANYRKSRSSVFLCSQTPRNSLLSPSASLPFRGQVTKEPIVKWLRAVPDIFLSFFVKQHLVEKKNALSAESNNNLQKEQRQSSCLVS